MTSVLTIASAASAQASQAVVVAPNSPVTTLTGIAGGPKKDTSCAGFIADQPNYEVTVTEDLDRSFTAKGGSDITLLIVNNTGKKFCVQADSTSNGTAELPGRWEKGTYSVFIGNRKQSQSPYTLVIGPIAN